MASNSATNASEDGGAIKTENEVSFVAPECPVEKVTIYPDRAEVCRRVEASLVAGLNQIVIKKLPEMVDPDSIRVEGKGAATITEVVFNAESVPKGEGDTSAKEKVLQDELTEMLDKRQLLSSELSVLKKQQENLESFAKTASKKDSELNDSFFSGMKEFLKFYCDEGNAIERKQLAIERERNALDEKINANNKNRRKLGEDKESTTEVKKCIILVDCKEDCKVCLLVSYVTANASWIPSYDIRMYTADNQLTITYYGQIKQSTGEDWVDAKLYLSTAQPSIGGEVPELLTSELRLRKPYSRPTSKKKALGFGFRGIRNSFRGARDEVEEGCAYLMASPEPQMAYMAPMEVAEAEVGEGVATTMYEIARRSTVPSDNVEHKVTVGLIDIKPKINYTCIPKVVPHAYMLAKVTNSSVYTFLAGETSIFLDNTFVGKASLRDVYPMEEFDCSLGVDPAVKVTYKPPKKYRASSGIISKTVSNTHEQIIEVKNTHNYAIQMLVTDQLPRSADERIKVNLLEPQVDMKHPEKNKDKGVTINSMNNLEWNLELKEMETKEVTLKYTVDYPANFNLYTEETSSFK